MNIIEFNTLFARFYNDHYDEFQSCVKRYFGVDNLEASAAVSSDFSSVTIRLINTDNRRSSATGSSMYAQISVGKGFYDNAHIRMHPDTTHYYAANGIPNDLRKIRGFSEATTVKAGLKAILTFYKEKFRKPVSTNCVQAFFGLTELLWVSKRRTSDKIAMLNDKYYLAEGLGSVFVRVNVARDEQKWLGVSDSSLRTDYIKLNGQYWAKSLVVPIYAYFDQDNNELGHVEKYELLWQAPLRFRSYERTVDGVTTTIYTVEQLPYSRYYAKPVHGYSERIESYLEPTDLFQMGSVDLYRRRPKEEVPFLGWELEACYANGQVSDATPIAFKEQLDKLVFCKNDGSIAPAGFETVSVPATLDFWKESNLSSALNVMRSAPYSMRSYNHSSCGFHCHVSRSSLSVLDLQKLERFMHNPANRQFLNDIAGRGPNTYQTYNEKDLFDNRAAYAKKRDARFFPEYRRTDYCTAGNLAQAGAGYNFFGFATTDKFLQVVRWTYYNVGIHTLMSNHADSARIGKSFAHYLTQVPEGITTDYLFESLQNGLRTYLGLTIAPYSEEELLVRLYQMSKDGSLGTSYGYYVRACLETAYPSKFTWDAEPDKKYEFRWEPRKTKLPIGRINSRRASQSTKGPTGKAVTGRYDVLNTRNDKTIEFRLFKGTMNPTSVFRYLEFVDAMVRFVGQTSATASGVSYNTFLNWLVKDSFNLMRYDNLVAFLVSKEYIDRKKIRRRELITPVEDDSSSIPAVTSTNSLSAVAELLTTANTTTITLDTLPTAPETYYEPEEDDYDEDACDCGLCQYNRGDITLEEFQDHPDFNPDMI